MMTTRPILKYIVAFVVLAALAILAFGCDLPDQPPRGMDADKTPKVRGAVLPRAASGGFTSIVEEGATLRVRWALATAPDSQRLRGPDSVSKASYLNAKINRTHRTAKFSAPMDRMVNIQLLAYRGGAARDTISGTYLVGDGELIPPPDSVPGDTAGPIPPPPPVQDAALSILEERVQPPVYSCQRTYTVSTGLRTALDTVKRGDCMELAKGSRFTGAYRLRAKPGNQFIVIRTQ